LAREIDYDESSGRAWETGKPEPSEEIVRAVIKLAHLKRQQIEDVYEKARTYWAV
jgi:hypothetical protein